MFAADGEIVDHDIVVRAPTQRGAVLGQLHFLDDNTVDRYDHFRHGRLLFLDLFQRKRSNTLFSQQTVEEAAIFDTLARFDQQNGNIIPPARIIGDMNQVFGQSVQRVAA
jgi:hypothetical protein